MRYWSSSLVLGGEGNRGNSDDDENTQNHMTK